MSTKAESIAIELLASGKLDALMNEDHKRAIEQVKAWKHEASVIREQLKSEHEKAIELFIDLHELKHAVKTLLDCKGRYNSEMAYRKLEETYNKITKP